MYWNDNHYNLTSSSYQVQTNDLLSETVPSIDRLTSYVKKYGVQSATFFIYGVGSKTVPSNCMVPTFINFSGFCLVFALPLLLAYRHIS